MKLSEDYPPEDTVEWEAAARIREIEAEVERARNILAGPDIGCLPNDWTLEMVADARWDDWHKMRDQVRDTCARAEAAEKKCDALRAEKEKLQEALRKIADDGRNCMDHCRHQARRALATAKESE